MSNPTTPHGATHTGTHRTDPAAVPAAGRAPVAPPAAGYVGAVLAVLLIAAGCIALRDGFIAAGWFGGPLWFDAAINWIDGLTFQGWMIAAGIAAVVIGAWILFSALRPRRATGIRLDAHSGIWIAPVDVARIAARAAQKVPGVLDAHTTATRRTLTVTAHTTGPNADIKADIETAVADAVTTILAAPPKLAVRLREGDRS